MAKIRLKTTTEKPCTSCKPSFFSKPAIPKKPACNKGCEIEEEEMPCEKEVLDASQVRYRLDCLDQSKLKSFGIPQGARLDSILEDIYLKVAAFNFLDKPKVPGKPNINTFQGVISDLYSVIEKQQEEINYLKTQL